MTSSTQITSMALPPELLEDQQTLDEAVAKAKRTRAAVDETAANIPALEADVQELTTKLAEKDADRAIADDGDVKALDTEIKKLGVELDSAQRALNRAKNALKIHEARAPEQDEAVQAAVVVLEQDLIALGGNMLEQLRAEILEKVKPLQGVFAAFRALRALGNEGVRDVIDAAWVPDPKGFMRLSAGAGSMNYGTNLLAEAPEPEHAQLAESISKAVAPVRASLAAAKALGSYVPLDKRPKAYVRRGYTTEGVKGDQRPFGGKPDPESGAPAAARPQPSGPRPLPPSTGRVRHGYAGQLPPGTPVDGDMGAQLVSNLMRTNGGSEFAV